MSSGINKAYIWLSDLLTGLLLGYGIYKYILALRNRRLVNVSEAVYQEWFASGYSMKNILTRLGGARGVLRLVVTKDVLWVTSWFPFSLIATFYDLEHVIPLEWITTAQVKEGIITRGIQVSYVDVDGKLHSLKLVPKDEKGFLKVLGKFNRI
jgi:hypothetical protein